jgi:hypothetical protein
MVLYEIFFRGYNTDSRIGGRFVTPFYGDYKISIIGLSHYWTSAVATASYRINSTALKTDELTTFCNQGVVSNYYQMIIPSSIPRSTTSSFELWAPKTYTVKNLSGIIDFDIVNFPDGAVPTGLTELGIVFNFEKIEK